MVRLLLLLVLVIIVGQAFWRLVDGIVEGVTGRPPSRRSRPPGNVPPHGIQMVRDPVCGTFVVPERSVTLAEGRTRLYFCSADCRDKYQAHQARPA